MASLRPAFLSLLEHLDAGRFGPALDALPWLRRKIRDQTWERREIFDLDIPNARDDGPRSDARWWCAWAIVSLAQGWPDYARKFAEWALDEDSRLGIAHYLRGRAIWSAHKPETLGEAAIELDEALAQGFVDPRVFHAQLELAVARNDQATAAAIALVVLETDPADAKARRARTEALVQLGHADQASDELESLEPEVRSQAAIARLGAWAALRSGRHAVAEQTLAAAIERSPSDLALLEQQVETWKARRLWYRVLIRKDLWLDRLGRWGRHVRRVAATFPMWLAMSGWTLIGCLAFHSAESVVRQTAGWVALAVAVSLAGYAVVCSQDATNWWRWLWRDPTTLRLFRSRARRHSRDEGLFLSVVLGLAALVAHRVGLGGLATTCVGLALLSSSLAPAWAAARGWRRPAAIALYWLAALPIFWAAAPAYVGVEHSLSTRQGLLLGLGASLLACGLVVAGSLARRAGLVAVAGSVILAAYLAGVCLGLETWWWECLGVLASLAAASGVVCLMVALSAPEPQA